MTKTSVFGRFNTLIDEGVHVLLSFAISAAAVLLGLDMWLAVICFLSAILIDIDHFFNPGIAKALGIKGFNGIKYGSGGYTIKIFHGFDVALAVSAACYLSIGDMLFSACLFACLCTHEIWDFLVYPHTWKELFLTSRISCRFKPGKRKFLTGLFFDISSLKY